jgi:hypothetical protein
MDFRIMCLKCNQATKYDALYVTTKEDRCDKCGELL